MGKQTKTQSPRDGERGAALITVVLMATLMLLAGGALIAVTSTSASLAADATSESQAYYAAEAGAQAVLGVLRGNSAPNPLFNSTVTDDANKITFRKAVTASKSNVSGDAVATPRLSRWLSYTGTSASAVVPIVQNYTSGSGMAFSVDEVTDPDTTDVIAYSTSGSVGSSGLQNGLNVNYTPAASTAVSTGGTSGAANIGSFSISISTGNGTYTATNVPFNLTITQTAPWAATKVVACTLNGSVTKTGGNLSGSLTLTLPASSFSLDGVGYTFSSATVTLSSASSTTVAITVAAPEPQRLRIKVTGYGPRNAVKKMQMLVSRYSFDYNATSTITLRSHDDNSTVLNANIGSSSVYAYDGNDNANGQSLPAFTVTGAQDAAFINSINSANNSSSGNQVQGYPGPARQVAVSSLDKFLQTTTGPQGARALLDNMRTAAKNVKTPGCTGTDAACDRYFASGEVPADIGAGTTDGLMTFVDGDYSMPPSGGAGLLIVTGTLTMSGNADFRGLILVLGGGHVERNGGGGDTSLGAMAVAHFDPTSGNFLEPTFNVQGGGSSTIRYDSDWIRKALKTTGPGVVGISEY